MKLSKWRIRYRRKAPRVFIDSCDAIIYEFCTDDSFTPVEAFRVGMLEIEKDAHWFESFDYRGQVEKIP